MLRAGVKGRAINQVTNSMTRAKISIGEAHQRLTEVGSSFEMEEIAIDGVLRRAWLHGPKTMSELVERSCQFGDAPFLVLDDQRVSFAAFRRATQKLASYLEELGVTEGDRVAIAMRNLPEWPVAFFAATALGAIAVPLNAWWVGSELLFALEDSGAKVLVADGERLNRVAGSLEECPLLKQVIVCRQESRGSEVTLESIIGFPEQWYALPERSLPRTAVGPDDCATIFYTSGTTEKPKGVVASHRAALSNITGAAFGAARAALREGLAPPQPADDQPQAGTLVVAPFFHVTGCFAILCQALHGGNRLVLMRRFEPEPAMQLIEEERLSWVICVPTIAWQLAEHPRVRDYDLSTMVSLGYGGAAAAPELIGRLKSALPEAVPGHGWGMTETCGLATTHSGEDYRQRPTSCGAPVAVVDIRIMDPQGAKELPTGQVGELWVSGPNVAKGYWGRPQETAETFVDGWVRTGDLARIDGEGFLYIVDRVKDLVIRGGENIYCIEVENCLFEHAGVADAAVVGMPHRTLGEVPIAVVQTRGDAATERSLLAHCASKLAPFKVPVAFVVQQDALPRNASGKLRKQEIAQGPGVLSRMQEEQEYTPQVARRIP